MATMARPLLQSTLFTVLDPRERAHGDSRCFASKTLVSAPRHHQHQQRRPFLSLRPVSAHATAGGSPLRLRSSLYTAVQRTPPLRIVAVSSSSSTGAEVPQPATPPSPLQEWWNGPGGSRHLEHSPAPAAPDTSSSSGSTITTFLRKLIAFAGTVVMFVTAVLTVFFVQGCTSLVLTALKANPTLSLDAAVEEWARSTIYITP